MLANKKPRAQVTMAELPTAQELIDLLNVLVDASPDKARMVEEQIINLIPAGFYEGYLGDDMTIVVCEVVRVLRYSGGSNIHTFVVEYRPRSGSLANHVQQMDLIEFLAELCRENGNTGSQYRGPRFWRSRAP